ncbi:hypothetical protein HM1_0094 [Heliomicrobium modesticaldum Ice1]|uniref:DUF3784 domain-containing protein n=1 Tax=Heliobacterium modesticaldum (strain ATCC 51547 / Ice1) TaxID=498761 RepID=B0TI46_HELMI|nr:DUF3784 domain-containing protein [Heliomicrobium modesticaldum]ABZ82719.1 hypothetical protein HM1_0094 [Heliomicrobium modesticaldum Ice1]
MKVNILLPLFNMVFFLAWGFALKKGKTVEWLAGYDAAKDKEGLVRWVANQFIAIGAVSLLLILAGPAIPERFAYVYFFGYLLLLALWLSRVSDIARKY